MALAILGLHHSRNATSAYLLNPIATISFVWFAFILISAHCNPQWRGKAPDMKVGIVVPAYQEDPVMLRAMLDSFEQQTIRPHAVILVENGVDKPTLKDIFDEWANTTSISLAQYLCNEEASKRKAQVMGIRLLNELNIGIDVLVTVDSDTRLDPKAIENGLIPFSDDNVRSVAGLLVSENRRTNWLTRTVDLSFVGSFVNGRAGWSAWRSVVVNCGGLAFYRMNAIVQHLDEYANQTVAGHPMSLGDDRMLTSFASLEGATVFNERSVGYTLMPENLGHLSRQRSRWWRSFWWGGLWLLRRHSPRRMAWWLVLSQYIAFILYAFVLPIVFVISPILNREVPWALIVYVVGLSYLRTARTLLIKRPDQSAGSQLLNWLILSPAATVLNIWICSCLQWYGLFTHRRAGWNTRQKVEVTKED